LAEKAFHNALVGRNKAHIAYFREPNILTREAFGKLQRELRQSL
jgi:hypothetical protein